MNLALIVPVLNRFDLFAGLIKSIDTSIRPFIIDNWNKNIGVAASWNKGMRLAMKNKYRYAIIANDDIVFTPKSIEKLYNCIRETKSVIISPNQNGIHGEGKLMEGSDFFCFIVDMPKLISECGEFDENFMPAYFEDNDMRYRIKLSGLKSYINKDIIVYHYGSQTQFMNPEKPITSVEQFENNRKYFIKKWGGLPYEEKYTSPFNNSNKTIKEW